MNLTPHSTTKIYLRLKNNKSFPMNLNDPVTLAELHELIVKKTEIPSHDLIAMHQGKQIHFTHNSQPISFKNQSILHIIDKKNLRNDIIEISVKFILRNDKKVCLGETKLFAKCEESIKEFIQKKVVRVIEQRTDEKIFENDLNLVLNGTVLNKQFNFHNYLIEDGSQIICIINNSEALSKSVHNVSIHKIFVSHQDKHGQGKRQIKSEQQLKSPPLQLSHQKRKSQVEKKTSLAMSQKRSEEFMKLQTFESKHELAEKERLLNEALQYEKDGKKLKKKLKITSDLARKFENERQEGHDYEQNQGIFDNYQKLPNPQIKKKDESAETKTKSFERPSVEISHLENKNKANVWDDEPDSPIDVEYPPVQIRGPSWVEWDPTIASKSVNQRSEKFETSQNGPSEINLLKEPFDLFFHGSLENEPKSTKDRIDDLSQKFTTLIKQPKVDFDISQIQVEYPKIQKGGESKLGDFLVSGSLERRPQTVINQELVNKFKEAINKINSKKLQDYGMVERQQKLKENLKGEIKNESNPEAPQSH